MLNDSMEDIIKRIKSRRLELGYSYYQLATLTNLSKSTLQRYETGSIKNIPLDKLKILSEGLQVSPEWIMGWNHTQINSSKIRNIAVEAIDNLSDEQIMKVVEYINYINSNDC